MSTGRMSAARPSDVGPVALAAPRSSGHSCPARRCSASSRRRERPARAGGGQRRALPARPGTAQLPHTVETARVAGGPWRSRSRSSRRTQNDPFRLRHCLPASCTAPGARVDNVDVVKNLVTANVLASLTPIPRPGRQDRAGEVPVVHLTGQGGVDTDPTTAGYGEGLPAGISGLAMGDPTLELKVRALGQATSPVTAGVSASISAPLGHATQPGLYAGDSSPVGTLRAIVDADVGRFFFGANLGGAVRSAMKVKARSIWARSSATGSALRRGAARRRLPGSWPRGSPATNFTTDAGSNAAEIDAAAQYAPARTPVVLTLGGGGGLNEGVGAPAYCAPPGRRGRVRRAIEGRRSRLGQGRHPQRGRSLPARRRRRGPPARPVLRLSQARLGRRRHPRLPRRLPRRARRGHPGSSDQRLPVQRPRSRRHPPTTSTSVRTSPRPTTASRTRTAAPTWPPSWSRCAPTRSWSTTTSTSPSTATTSSARAQLPLRGARSHRPGHQGAPRDQAPPGGRKHRQRGPARDQPGALPPPRRRGGRLPGEQGRRAEPPGLQRLRARQARRLQRHRGGGRGQNRRVQFNAF